MQVEGLKYGVRRLVVLYFSRKKGFSPWGREITGLIFLKRHRLSPRKCIYINTKSAPSIMDFMEPDEVRVKNPWFLDGGTESECQLQALAWCKEEFSDSLVSAAGEQGVFSGDSCPITGSWMNSHVST